MIKDNNKFEYEIIKARPLYTVNPLTQTVTWNSHFFS